MSNNHIEHKAGFGMREYFWECENIPMFNRGFEAILSRRTIIPKTFSSPPMGIQHSHRKGIFAIIKRLNYPYHLPKPLAADHHPPLVGQLLLSSTADHRPPTATSIKGIFGNLWNILVNSTCTLNILKISYPEKLFPEIVFKNENSIRLPNTPKENNQMGHVPNKCPPVTFTRKGRNQIILEKGEHPWYDT